MEKNANIKTKHPSNYNSLHQKKRCEIDVATMQKSCKMHTMQNANNFHHESSNLKYFIGMLEHKKCKSCSLSNAF